jgi:Fe-Mn family superoxide dismutase
MASALLRSTPALRAGLRARSTPLAAMATTSFVRTKATLPDLPCKAHQYALDFSFA